MKITVLDRCTVTTGDVSLSPIEALGDVAFYDTVSPKKIAKTIGESDAVICNKAQITDEIMEKCKNLRYIGLFATGYNNIDIEAAKKRGITVIHDNIEYKVICGTDVPSKYSTITARKLYQENNAKVVEFATSMLTYDSKKNEPLLTSS